MPDRDVTMIAQQGRVSADAYASIMELAAVCNAHDRIVLKINPDMLQSRPDHETGDFLCYRGAMLVGYLGVYQFNQREVEISGMVHPDHRRRGIFSALTALAKDEAARRGIPKLVFINAKPSESGRHFLEALGARYAFSEHWMTMAKAARPQLRPGVRLELASEADLPGIAQLMAVSFGLDVNEMQAKMIERREVALGKRRVVKLNDLTIGTLAVDASEPGSAFIYGFCVAPEHRRRGYGRQALALAVMEALADYRAKIELEVACDNEPALTLYRSCGFEVAATNDYYAFTLPAPFFDPSPKLPRMA